MFSDRIRSEFPIIMAKTKAEADKPIENVCCPMPSRNKNNNKIGNFFWF